MRGEKKNYTDDELFHFVKAIIFYTWYKTNKNFQAVEKRFEVLFDVNTGPEFPRRTSEACLEIGRERSKEVKSQKMSRFSICQNQLWERLLFLVFYQAGGRGLKIISFSLLISANNAPIRTEGGKTIAGDSLCSPLHPQPLSWSSTTQLWESILYD